MFTTTATHNASDMHHHRSAGAALIAASKQASENYTSVDVKHDGKVLVRVLANGSTITFD